MAEIARNAEATAIRTNLFCLASKSLCLSSSSPTPIKPATSLSNEFFSPSADSLKSAAAGSCFWSVISPSLLICLLAANGIHSFFASPLESSTIGSPDKIRQSTRSPLPIALNIRISSLTHLD